MNNIEILERLEQMQQAFIEDGLQGYEMTIVTAKNLINNLIQENKKMKEKFDVIQRKIYRLEEDNIELLKPRGKDQLNYKYIECPKVEAEWYKSESYIKEKYIPKIKVEELKEKIHNLLDNNGITRAYQLEIDKYFEDLEEGE